MIFRFVLFNFLKMDYNTTTFIKLSCLEVGGARGRMKGGKRKRIESKMGVFTIWEILTLGKLKEKWKEIRRKKMTLM